MRDDDDDVMDAVKSKMSNVIEKMIDNIEFDELARIASPLAAILHRHFPPRDADQYDSTGYEAIPMAVAGNAAFYVGTQITRYIVSMVHHNYYSKQGYPSNHPPSDAQRQALETVAVIGHSMYVLHILIRDMPLYSENQKENMDSQLVHTFRILQEKLAELETQVEDALR